MRKKYLFLLSILLAFIIFLGGLKAFHIFPFDEKVVLTSEELPTDVKQQLGEELKKLPNKPVTYEDFMTRGDLFAERNFFALAINEYVQATKIKDDSANPYIKIGEIHLKNNNAEQAEQAFIKALEKDTENLDARIRLGKTYLLAKNPAKAKEIFEQISAKNQLVRYYQGMIRAFFEEYEKSKEAFQEAVEINTNPDITNKSKNFLNAFDEFSKTLGGQKTHLKTLLGRSYNQVDEYNLAITILYQVIQEKKDYRDAWLLLGYAYLQTEQYKSAMDALMVARKLDPGKSETLYFLGLAYFAQNDLDNAAKYLEGSLQAGYEPRIQALQKAAEVYFQQSNFDRAIKKYEEVLNVNTNDINYFVRPIWIYIDKMKDATKALELAKQAVATHPNSAMSYNLLGWAQISSGAYNEAQQNLQKAIQMDPTLDAAYLNMGWLNENLNNLETAKTYYQKALEIGKDASVVQLAQQRLTDLANKTIF